MIMMNMGHIPPVRPYSDQFLLVPGQLKWAQCQPSGTGVDEALLMIWWVWGMMMSIMKFVIMYNLQSN